MENVYLPWFQNLGKRRSKYTLIQCLEKAIFFLYPHMTETVLVSFGSYKDTAVISVGSTVII
jgi:hypothetical protein